GLAQASVANQDRLFRSCLKALFLQNRCQPGSDDGLAAARFAAENYEPGSRLVRAFARSLPSALLLPPPRHEQIVTRACLDKSAALLRLYGYGLSAYLGFQYLDCFVELDVPFIFGRAFHGRSVRVEPPGSFAVLIVFVAQFYGMVRGNALLVDIGVVGRQ